MRRNAVLVGVFVLLLSALIFVIRGQSVDDSAGKNFETGPLRSGTNQVVEEPSEQGEATMTSPEGSRNVELVANRFAVIGDRYGMRNVAADFEEMVALAMAGDPRAASTILSALNYCDASNIDSVTTQAAFEKRMREINHPDSKYARDPLLRDAKIQELQRNFSWCKGLTDDHFARRKEVLETAIGLGVEGALAQYERAAYPNDTWREGYEDRVREHHLRVKEMYDRAIGEGNLQALLLREPLNKSRFVWSDGDNDVGCCIV